MVDIVQTTIETSLKYKGYKVKVGLWVPVYCDWYSISQRVYPKVSGLASSSQNCKWYSSVPLGAVVSLFYESF
jgi:hypothetical protein